MSSLWKGLTFGVELEFMTPTPYQSLWRSISPAAAARYNVAKHLAKITSLPVACECLHDKDSSCAVCADIPSENMLDDVGIINRPEATSEAGIKNACFLFKPEFLVYKNTLNANRCWPGIEMCTPVFGQGELASGLATMKTVLSTIRQMGLDITADDSCGMHVHVGVEGGMTLYLAKRIATLVVLLENTLILRLVAPSRWTNDWAMPICQRSQAAVQEARTGSAADVEAFQKHIPSQSTVYPSKWNSDDPAMLFKILSAIWFCKDLKDLSSVLRRDGFSRCGLAICLRGRIDSPARLFTPNNFEGTSSTVEFRYSQMTFDHVLLRNWVEVVARIVDLAHAEGDEFKEIVEMIVSLNHEADLHRDAAWKPLLKYVFKMEHRIPDWEAQLDKFKRGEYISLLDKSLLLQAEDE